MQPSYASQDYPFKLWQRFEVHGMLPRYQGTTAEVAASDLQAHALVDCVVVAAGIGARMLADRPKQYLMIGEHSILEWTVCQILQAPSVRRVVLVLHPEDRWFKNTCLATNPQIRERIVTVNGGKERVDSVLCGLQAVESEWCLVHDAARPFVNVADIEYLLSSVKQCNAQDESTVGGILAQPETDTLKRRCAVPSKLRHASDKNGKFDKWGAQLQDGWVMPDNWGFTHMTEDRSQVARAQTPQMFRTHYLRDKLTACLAQGKLITDEASVVDGLDDGGHVLLIPGSNFNFKITTPEDLVLAKALVEYMQRS